MKISPVAIFLLRSIGLFLCILLVSLIFRHYHVVGYNESFQSLVVETLIAGFVASFIIFLYQKWSMKRGK